ncbi:14751_t:CDS:2, partial [Acaulospora colombiana]
PSDDNSKKNLPFLNQLNSYGPPPSPYSQPPNIHPPTTWSSQAGSPHSMIEQTPPYQQSLPPQAHHSHPYESAGPMRHMNPAPGYSYQSMGSTGTQIIEQSLAKMSKVVDYCNQISQHVSQYRDAQTFQNSWSSVPRISEARLTDMINLTHDVLEILNDLKGELTSKAVTGNVMDEDFDLLTKSSSTISSEASGTARKMPFM